MHHLTDSELLRNYAQSGAETAFAILVQRYVDFVYSAAVRLVRDPHLAEDVTQRVFVALARQSNGLAGRLILSGWLHRTTRNISAETVRATVRRRAREREAATMNTVLEGPPDAAWDELAPQLDEALGQLAERDRDALLLRYFQQRSAKEMAALLGLSEEAAQKRVSRALGRLRDCLGRRGVPVAASTLAVLLSTHAVTAAPALLTPAVTAAVAQGIATTATGAIPPVLTAGVSSIAKASWVAGLAIAGVLAGLVITAAVRSPAGTKSGLPTGATPPHIAMGNRHGVILAGDGSLWSWGENFAGWPVLGQGSVATQAWPRQIDAAVDWAAISCSPTHCLALKTNGSLWAWGENLYGQLGIRTGSRRSSAQKIPVQAAPDEGWVAVAAGGSHSAALRRDGTLWTWGNNWAGQLGLGLTNDRVAHASQVGSESNWSRVWAEGVLTVAQKTDGTLWHWGSLTGDSGDRESQLRIPAQVSPDTNWVNVAFGYFNAFGLKSDGTLWTWGRHAGIYTGGEMVLRNPTPRRVGHEADWVTLAGSGYFYQLLGKRDGTVWALDASEYSYVDKPRYEPVRWFKIEIPRDVVALGVAGRGPAGVALTRSGAIWTWGAALGQQTAGWPTLDTLVTSAGWRTERFKPQPLIREKPWQLPCMESVTPAVP